jgi:hypothetical protein
MTMKMVQYQTTGSEYVDALRSTRLAKNVLSALLAVCIVAQIAAFVLVHFVGVIDPPAVAVSTENVPRPAPEAGPEPPGGGEGAEPAGAAAGREAAPAQPEQGSIDWRFHIEWILRATKFAGLVTCGLLVLVLMLAVKLSLLDRVGGAAGFLGAFYWSLVLLAIVVPWQDVLADYYVGGALFGLPELVSEVAGVKGSWGARDVGIATHVLYFMRFLVYPIVSLLVWVMVQLRFGGGFRRMSASTVLGEGGPPRATEGPMPPEPEPHAPEAGEASEQ